MASESSWSGWQWDANRQQYYCFRLNAEGKHEYFYAEDTTPQLPSTPQGPTHQQPYATDQQPSYTPLSYSQYPSGYNDSSSNTGGTPKSTDYSSPYQGYLPFTPTRVPSSGIGGQQWAAPTYAQTNAQAVPPFKADYIGNGLERLATLDPLYKRVKQKDQKEFFRTGRVFKTLWVEPAGHTSTGRGLSTVSFGESAYAEIRRFVVLSSTELYSRCSPITTYSGQATTKPGVISQDHSVIYYDHEREPNLLVGEELTKKAIRVSRSKISVATLDPLSRLDFGRPHTVHHTAKVVDLGMVVKEQRHLLDAYCRQSQS